MDTAVYFLTEAKAGVCVQFATAATCMYRAMGIPENMFTVMFALARLPGWIAHWKEMAGGGSKIVRPRQIYIGKTEEETRGVMANREPQLL